MWASSVTAYFHYLGFMLAFAAQTLEVFNFKPEMTLDEAKRVAFADAAQGVAATAISSAGILRIIYFGKGTDYYFSNAFFYAKMGMFVVVSLLSLYPTFTFISRIKDFRDERITKLEFSKFKWLSGLIKGELICLTILPLLAAIMARNSGLH